MVMSHHQKAYGRFILKLQLLLEDLLQFFRVKVFTVYRVLTGPAEVLD